jgi:hypothetical protein
MNAPAVAIPYERQAELENHRTCGAACLSMVYRSLGKQVPQTEIWSAIAKVNRFGSLASTTHLMAQDALSRGFAAIAIQARHPLQVLRQCRDSGIRAILNHRVKKDSPAGHYSVLVEIDDESVTLHDPFLSPSRQLSHADIVELWQPRFSNAEIVGNMLIGIAPQSSEEPECWLCHTPLPPGAECPNCKKIVSLRPAVLLGCTNDICITRLWNYVCCPFCDQMLTFNFAARESGAFIPSSASAPSGSAASGPAASDTQSAAARDESPWMKPLFAEIDKFCNQILSLPGAASHHDIKELLDALVASKGKIEMAQAETLFYQKMAHERLMKMQEQAAQAKTAQRKKMEELDKPSPPLDGDALARALLKNLGFTK